MVSKNLGTILGVIVVGTLVLGIVVNLASSLGSLSHQESRLKVRNDVESNPKGEKVIFDEEKNAPVTSSNIIEPKKNTKRHDPNINASDNVTIVSVPQRDYDPFEGVYLSPSSPAFPVLNVMRDYINMHSGQQLERELESCIGTTQNETASLLSKCKPIARRRFAIAFYSCPYQAGNRLHHFMNGLIWAVVTNRTLLWKYLDSNVCKAFHMSYECQWVGTKDKCDRTLTLSPWLASYDDWGAILNLPMTRVNWWSTHIKPPPDIKKQNHRHPWIDGSEKYTGIDDTSKRLLDFGFMVGRDSSPLSVERNRDYLLHTSGARVIAAKLSNAGVPFMYGTIFHASFSFTKAVLPVSMPPLPDPRTTFTVAVHSRHSDGNDDGSNVASELKCLRQVLSKSNMPSCAVYLMSDRPKSVTKLLGSVRELNCTPIANAHSRKQISTSGRSEHGPFAGSEFFMDLALVSNARHAIIGSNLGRRTSTMLLEELMEYRRLTEEYNDTGVSGKKLVRCSW